MTHNTKEIQTVLLSGGSGQRLWPLSRSQYPKQLLTLCGDDALIIGTAKRVQGNGFSDPIIICNEDHRFLIASMFQQAEISYQDLVLEPLGRNTAPAAAIAALQALKKTDKEDACVLLLPSDHVIPDIENFQKTIHNGYDAAMSGHIVTFGIHPTHPETGYGYIEADTTTEVLSTLKVKRFTEKPDIERAKAFVKDGNYFWNSGIFLFSANSLIAELEKHAPEILSSCKDALNKACPDLDFLRLDKAAYENCPSDSIDYAIMEKTDKVVTLPVQFKEWSDIGSWNALWDWHSKDENENVTIGDVILKDTSGSYIHSEKGVLTSVLGVDNMVIVNTGDAVLVAERGKSQEVKKIVNELATAKREEHLFHQTVYRPWGHYRTLAKGGQYLVKEIEVSPKSALSTQYHHHRAEHWVVVEGTAEVLRGDEELTVHENESIFIPLGAIHKLTNSGTTPLRLIEIQSGSYLSEDDIVRIDDHYGRANS
ncbi:mannose-1-phosphate guanyltransferase [Candidatus Terasakiella magnetica]|uniref:mannose-1-phosphate guanylyltransferase n=1 Tax=Candidatus Terasakiella magnetica TaxID=1867952 RepID=A0A1C3RGB1_9PROT|nr:mannose-1-phosphate guanylyltransferase/mannose-6-phosphate isomerase [Candidatus Terasakiella magnetica]SCA56288.1 mannose-1-phosphate guanyltransferase [Candidatus Terasakiella magnetica]